MLNFYDFQSEQWQSAAERASSELLHSSCSGEFQISSFRGRLTAATDLQYSPDGDQILFCLNEEGGGLLAGRSERNFRASNLLFLRQPPGADTTFQRFAGNHRFIHLAFSTSYLRDLLKSNAETLSPPIAASLGGDSSLVFTEPMSNSTKAKAYLIANLDVPLKLEAVARAAGTSPHYLSRTFSSETGHTLSRYLRHLRIDRAAQLLATSHLNISEVAIEVGYRSQSHFARAFEIEKSSTPSQYIADLRSGDA